MSEINNVGQTWMNKSNELASLPFKGLNYGSKWAISISQF